MIVFKRLLLRGLGRSGSRVGSRSGGSIGSRSVSGRSSSGIGSGSRRSGGIGRRSGGVSRRSGGIRSRSFRILLGAASHQRESRDRGGECNIQFHVGVPQKYLVVSETKQTFVATIFIAARDFSRFPDPFETTAICPLMATVLRGQVARSPNLADELAEARIGAFVALRQCSADQRSRIESSHEFTCH